jgi:hypothetical protein
MADQRDPRRIALIAVRTGSGEGGSHSSQAQAIIVGEVPVVNGIIVDPATNPNFMWEWRHALFKLDDLDRLFVNASRASGKTAWMDIPHPLSGPGAYSHDFYKPTYYDVFGPNAQLLLDRDEKNDVLSADELPAGLIAKLQEPIHPTSMTPVPRVPQRCHA